MDYSAITVTLVGVAMLWIAILTGRIYAPIMNK